MIARQVVAETAIDKRLDHVGEGDENLEVKSLQQERQDVLRANAFETIGGTVLS